MNDEKIEVSEQDYCDIGDLARINAAISILRKCHCSDELRDALPALSKLSDRLFAKVKIRDEG